MDDVKKEKVLLFFPNCEAGGTERVLSIFSHYMNEDYELHIMTMSSNKLPYEFSYSGLSEFVFFESHSKGLWAKAKRYFYLFRRLSKYCKQNNIEKIISFGEVPNFVGALYKKFINQKCKLFLNVRNSESVFLEQARFGWLIKKSIQFTYPIANKVLTNSNGNKEDLLRNIGLNLDVSVIYNPVNSDFEYSYNKKSPEEFFMILNIGRLNVQKGQNHLLKAFAKLIKVDKVVAQLVIVGEGELESELKYLCSDLGIIDHVRFNGWCSNVSDFYKRADVFVLSSFWEGMPNVVLEAMSYGCPVISYDCPSGPREIITKPGVNGVLVPCKDIDSLYVAMKDFYEREENRYKLSSQAFLRSKDFLPIVIYKKFKEEIDG